MIVKDKVIVVSGIGPGLGIKLAIEAAREGARVALAARTPVKLDEAEQRMREVVPHCEVLKQPTDILDRRQCKRLVETTMAHFGRVDGLINSAFFHGNFRSMADSDLGVLSKTVDTNLIGTINLTQEAISAMKQGGGGAIVMINTMSTRQARTSSEAAYAASKGALMVAAKYLALDLGPSNIRVNTLLPGWMWGVPVQTYVKQAAAAQKVPEEVIIARITANIPLRRIVKDEECARAALFLVSDYASGITGAQLDANGGQFMAC